MLDELSKGRYCARFVGSVSDLERAQRLRALVFRAGSARPVVRDRDDFDARCSHVLVEDVISEQIVCTFRLMALSRGGDIARSYSAQFYGFAALARFEAPMLEIGRFCIAPDRHDPDILRVAWGAMTRIVDAEGIGMMFGCSSFPGTEAGKYCDAFALLKDRHLAPRRWAPQVKAPLVERYAQTLSGVRPDLRRAMQEMPPLLRSYLAMGGWVSDHAVVDVELNTLHVFTGLEVGAIPPARARLLRAMAG